MAYEPIVDRIVQTKPDGTVVRFIRGFINSDDPKPVTGIYDRSELYERDTGKWYLFNMSMGEWFVPDDNTGSGSGGGSGDVEADKIIASAYSTSGAYAAGSYVTKGGKLYKAKQTVSNEPWTAAHWEETKIMNEVSSIEPGTVLPDPSTGTNGMVVSVNNGEYVLADAPQGGGDSELPDASQATEGNVLTVHNGEWIASAPQGGGSGGASELPDASQATEGDILTVHNGEWIASEPQNGDSADIQSISEGTFTTKELRDSDILSGYFATTNGQVTSSNNWARTSCDAVIDSSIAEVKIALNKYKLLLIAFTKTGSYVGTWFGNGFTNVYDATYKVQSIDIATFRKQYPNYVFNVNVALSDSGLTFDFNEVKANLQFIKSIAKANEIKINVFYGEILSDVDWTYATIDAAGKRFPYSTSASTSATQNNVSNYNKRISTAQYLRFITPVTIIAKAGYAFSVTTYSLDGVFETQFSAWYVGQYTISDTNKLYCICIKQAENGGLLLTSVSNYIEIKPLYSMPYNRMLSEFANIKAVNHRGFNIVPENNLLGYKMSGELGFKYVETDVLFTSDGVPVLMHDATLNRTCCNAADGSALASTVEIANVSYADLIANYDSCTPAQWSTWRGIKVPTFAEFIHCCKVYNLHPWIELKHSHTYTATEIQSIIATIKNHGMEEHVSFISFSADALALVAAEWDTVELGVNGTNATIAQAEALRTEKNRVFMTFPYNYNAESINAAIAAGFEICIYTVNTLEQLASTTITAYDSVLTDCLLPCQICDVARTNFTAFTP